jgi:hypothetical protein
VTTEGTEGKDGAEVPGKWGMLRTGGGGVEKYRLSRRAGRLGMYACLCKEGCQRSTYKTYMMLVA